MAMLPKLVYRFITIPIKIPPVFFAEIDKLVLKFSWKCKGPRIAKTILIKNKDGGLRQITKQKKREEPRD